MKIEDMIKALNKKDWALNGDAKKHWTVKQKDANKWFEKTYVPEAAELFDKIKSKKKRTPTEIEYMQQYCNTSLNYVKTLKEQYLSDLGKHRVWIVDDNGDRKKVWQQTSYSYDGAKDDRCRYDHYPSDRYVIGSNVMDNKAHTIDILDTYYANSQAVFGKALLMIGEEETKEKLELSDKTFKQKLSRFEKSAEKKRSKYIDLVKSEKEEYIAKQLKMVNRVIGYVEGDKVNDSWLFKLLIAIQSSSLGFIYKDCFGSDYEIEMVVKSFKEQKNRKAAYKIINRLYDLRAELE